MILVKKNVALWGGQDHHANLSEEDRSAGDNDEG
jgi:hypothetical protein